MNGRIEYDKWVDNYAYTLIYNDICKAAELRLIGRERGYKMPDIKDFAEKLYYLNFWKGHDHPGVLSEPIDFKLLSYDIVEWAYNLAKSVTK